MAKNKYKFYSDAGHGWLAVKITELVNLGILDQVTVYSYFRGKTAYLEEDCDLSTFVKAKEKIGEKVEMIDGKFQDRSPIRSYERFPSKG